MSSFSSKEFLEELREKAKSSVPEVVEERQTYVDPTDGTVYEWDREKQGWFPKVFKNLMLFAFFNYFMSLILLLAKGRITVDIQGPSFVIELTIIQRQLWPEKCPYNAKRTENRSAKGNLLLSS